MNCKKALTLFLILLMSVSFMRAQKSTTDVILSSYSAKNFTPDPVSDKDLRTILECGIKAPSAMNKQPWKFTVVKDDALVSELIRNAVKGNVLVIVSGAESATSGSTAEFDCALAVENMYVAAQSLGLGSHIYMSGVSAVNNKKEAYGIPAGYKAISILRLGSVPQNSDANSSASTRTKFEDVVIFK